MFLAFELTSSHIVGGIVGALATIFVERLVTKGKAGKACPACGAELPSHRRPTSLRQALVGGWTCGKCGAELDRNAQPRS